jgi:sodium transport system permease protein
LGKILAVITSTLITSLLAVISLGLSFYFAKRAGAPGVLSSLSIDRTTLLLTGTVIVPMAILISALIIAIATLAMSYKEAQSYLTPLTIIALFSAMVSLLPCIKLNAGLPLVPIVNFSQLIKELILGVDTRRLVLDRLNSEALLNTGICRRSILDRGQGLQERTHTV